VALTGHEWPNIIYGMANSDLGMRIRRARERKRWSQEQLAAALGVGVRSVGRWERGEAGPRNAIGALEEVLGVDLSGNGGTPVFTDPDEAHIWHDWADLTEAQRWELIMGAPRRPSGQPRDRHLESTQGP
jgi:transcriptional regulator with XRE-family HTH domain